MEQMGREFMQKLETYIRENYMEPSNELDQKTENREKCEPEKEGVKSFDLPQHFTMNLADLMNETGETFHEALFYYIDRSGLKDSEVYKKAGIDRKLFSKIRSNPAYHPSKNTVLALAIALELNLKETEDLLSRAEYAFSPANKGDLIIKFFIEHKVFDLMTINFTLHEYEQSVLGN